MKPIRLTLAVAVAALGLQACDVSVKPQASSSTPAATQQAQQPAAPVDSTPTPVQSTEAPATPSGATTPGAAADPSAAAQAPGAPETTAMGAQPAPAPAVPDGIAAPTELAQFFEQNAIKPKAQ